MSWEKFGEIRKSKGGNLYIKINDDIDSLTFKGKDFNGKSFERKMSGGDTIMIQKCLDEIDMLVENGAITEEQGEKRKSLYEEGGKLSFIKYTLKCPPDRD